MNLFIVFHNSGYPGEETSSVHMGQTYQGAMDAVPEDFRDNHVEQADWPEDPAPYTSAVESSLDRELLEFYSDGTGWYSVVAFETI